MFAQNFLDRSLALLVLALLAIGAWIAFAPRGGSAQASALPFANYTQARTIAPAPAGASSIELDIAADIEADVRAENLTPLVALGCTLKPAVRVEVFADRKLSRQLADVELFGTFAGFFHAGFDGALDYGGVSGDAYTTSTAHRVAHVHVELAPGERAPSTVFVRVRNAGLIQPHGAWRAEFDVFADVQVSASASP